MNFEEKNLTKETSSTNPNSWRNKVSTFFQTKKGKVVLWGAFSVALIALFASVAIPRYIAPVDQAPENNNQTPPPNISIDNQPEPEPEPEKFYSTLDGTETSQGNTNMRPLAVVVENHPQARPQAGFLEASHVWEYITEGGITRFLAVYGPQLPNEVGPIRSARSFSVSWASGYNALFAHAGGSQGGLNLLAGSNNITALSHHNSYFFRKPAPGVASEHTLFSTGENLINFARQKSANLTGNFRSHLFKDTETPASERPTANTLTVNFSTPGYAVKWTYNPTTNKYEREMAGIKHVDRTTRQQITASNIVVMTVRRSFTPNTNNGNGEWFMTTEGEGAARIYSEGKVTIGKWHKSAKNQMVVLRDEAGREIPLLAGQTWFEVIPPDSSTSYTGN